MGEFLISAKASHEIFSSGWFHKYDVRTTLTSDIIQNMRELTHGVDIEELLGYIRLPARLEFTLTGSPYVSHRGERTIRKFYAFTIGSIASQMVWDMDTPEIVYLSGYLLYDALNSNIESLRKRLGNTEILYSSEEKKRILMEKKEAELERIIPAKEFLETQLEEFVAQHGLLDNRYLEILRGLLRLSGKSTLRGNIRKRIYDALKNKDIDTAYLIWRQQQVSQTE